MYEINLLLELDSLRNKASQSNLSVEEILNLIHDLNTTGLNNQTQVITNNINSSLLSGNDAINSTIYNTNKLSLDFLFNQFTTLGDDIKRAIIDRIKPIIQEKIVIQEKINYIEVRTEYTVYVLKPSDVKPPKVVRINRGPVKPKQIIPQPSGEWLLLGKNEYSASYYKKTPAGVYLKLNVCKENRSGKEISLRQYLIEHPESLESFQRRGLI